MSNKSSLGSSVIGAMAVAGAFMFLKWLFKPVKASKSEAQKKAELEDFNCLGYGHHREFHPQDPPEKWLPLWGPELLKQYEDRYQREKD